MLLKAINPFSFALKRRPAGVIVIGRRYRRSVMSIFFGDVLLALWMMASIRSSSAVWYLSVSFIPTLSLIFCAVVSVDRYDRKNLTRQDHWFTQNCKYNVYQLRYWIHE